MICLLAVSSSSQVVGMALIPAASHWLLLAQRATAAAQSEELQRLGEEAALRSAEQLAGAAVAAAQQRLKETTLTAEEATALVVNGFVKDVLQQLPMEFAVEAQKLISVSLEGSVG